jgi:DtxR family Mn-dependent transcriptional regulator
MLPTSTVENYLKAIHAGQTRLPRGEGDRDLVPMGQLSAALGVVPGTATAMVKTLAEAGLAYY